MLLSFLRQNISLSLDSGFIYAFKKFMKIFLIIITPVQKVIQVGVKTVNSLEVLQRLINSSQQNTD